MDPQPQQDLDTILRLLERSVTGEASRAEEAELARWIAASPARQRIVDALRAQWGAVPERHDVDAGWARLASQIHGAEASGPVREIGTEGRRRRYVWRVAAACAAGIVGLLAFRSLQAPQPRRPQIFASAARQRLDLRLGDGTHVLLAPESRLRLASDFGTQRRDVYVEGEAYFEVAHDSSRPFTVFAANASTRDVGTAFAVRSYAGERAVRVVVSDGQVAMSGAGLLGAGDVGRLSADGRASVRHHANLRVLLGWTDGQLVFEDAPLGQVLADLRRWYGVEAQLADSSLGALPFTGSLRQVSPENAIALVAATVGLRVRHAGALVVLEKP